MSLNSYLSEIDSIQKEMNRLNKVLAPLRKRKKELEKNIQEGLLKKNMSEIKYKDITYKITPSNIRTRKNDTQKTQDTTNVLLKYGIRNSNTIISEIMEAQKGELTEVDKLKIKNNKN
tara:strand:- start:391 stop:744 length:354 start_codon:yes stop_codon:yes gene_type:complete